MPDTKLRPSSKHSAMWILNATNRNSYLNIICIKLVTRYTSEKETLKNWNSFFWLEVFRFKKKLKFGLFENFRFLNQKHRFLKPTSTAARYIGVLSRNLQVLYTPTPLQRRTAAGVVMYTNKHANGDDRINMFVIKGRSHRSNRLGSAKPPVGCCYWLCARASKTFIYQPTE